MAPEDQLLLWMRDEFGSETFLASVRCLSAVRVREGSCVDASTLPCVPVRGARRMFWPCEIGFSTRSLVVVGVVVVSLETITSCRTSPSHASSSGRRHSRVVFCVSQFWILEPQTWQMNERADSVNGLIEHQTMVRFSPKLADRVHNDFLGAPTDQLPHFQIEWTDERHAKVEFGDEVEVF